MVVGPGVVVYAVVDLRVGVAGTFCTELPYAPVVAVFGIEELDELR